MVAQYGKFLPSSSINGSVIGAGGPPALRDLQLLLVSAGYDTLGLVDRTSIGDISLGITDQLINSLTDTAATHGYPRVGQRKFPLRHGTDRKSQPSCSTSPPDTDSPECKSAALPTRSSTDATPGTAVGSFTKQLGSVDVARVPNAANAVFPLSDPSPGTYSAGDVLWLSIAPRVRISGYLTFNGLYMLTHIGADQYIADLQWERRRRRCFVHDRRHLASASPIRPWPSAGRWGARCRWR